MLAAPSHENLLQTKKKINPNLIFDLKQERAEITSTIKRCPSGSYHSVSRDHTALGNGPTPSSSSDLTSKLIIQAGSSWHKRPLWGGGNLITQLIYCSITRRRGGIPPGCSLSKEPITLQRTLKPSLYCDSLTRTFVTGRAAFSPCGLIVKQGMSDVRLSLRVWSKQLEARQAFQMQILGTFLTGTNGHNRNIMCNVCRIY